MADKKNKSEKIVIHDGDEEEIKKENSTGAAEKKEENKGKAPGKEEGAKASGEEQADAGNSSEDNGKGSTGERNAAGKAETKDEASDENKDAVKDKDNEGAETAGAESSDEEEAPGDSKAGKIIAELKDRCQRQLAEFENFRNRSEREKSGMYEAGSRSVIEKILPVVDNFERALESPPEDEASKAFTEGVQMIYKQLMQELEKIGVEKIDAVGKPFDPNLHNAVMQVQSDEYESGTVVQELQKGYTHHGTVVRHSMVGVAE
ncbi:MAG: nucleotide exchange factor GrpE [Lachnospiraceae bacterium]|nr:nucleotide exchange factor GrpE [Lachnospiraceae bacterium]